MKKIILLQKSILYKIIDFYSKSSKFLNDTKKVFSAEKVY